MAEKPIGNITHFYKKINVAVLVLTAEIRVGDHIHILGHTSDFKQSVTSLQIEHNPVVLAGPGDDVALKVAGRVRPGDTVLKVIDAG
jgi:putative protease